MMKIKHALLAIAFALPLGAFAQSQDQLVERYTEFAGSKDNATQLVTGMRDGKTVTLKEGTTTQTVEFTNKMGYGNIDNALALAEASINKTDPSLAEINAALNGGTAGGKTYEGILKMRYEDKMGWGQIAQALGFKSLGEVKRSDKAPAAASGQSAARPDRPANGKPEKPERPDKPERPGKGR